MLQLLSYLDLHLVLLLPIDAPASVMSFIAFRYWDVIVECSVSISLVVTCAHIFNLRGFLGF